MTEHLPDPTHRPLNADTMELDTLSPRDREVVEKIMVDLNLLFEEKFIGVQNTGTMQQSAERLVADMNRRPEDLRVLAETLTGRAVDSCVVVFDGLQGTDLLMSHQIEFATEGPHYEAWMARQDEVFAVARAAATDVLDQELGSDETEANAE